MLSSLVGPEIADNIVNVTFPSNRRISKWPENDLKTEMSILLEKEVSDIQCGCRDLRCIFEDATNGLLGTTLKKKINLLRPVDYGATEKDSDFDKSARWIYSNSKTYKNNVEDESGNQALDRVKLNIHRVAQFGEPWNMSIIQELHLACAPELKETDDAERESHREAKYPSSPGGRFLLNYAIDLMKNGQLNSVTKKNSLDAAAFLLSSIIRSHAFSDGNGRTARAAYVCALQQGNHAFVAPRFEIENEMHRMDRMEEGDSPDPTTTTDTGTTQAAGRGLSYNIADYEDTYPVPYPGIIYLNYIDVPVEYG